MKGLCPPAGQQNLEDGIWIENKVYKYWQRQHAKHESILQTERAKWGCIAFAAGFLLASLVAVFNAGVGCT